jgi:hypothetical protein
MLPRKLLPFALSAALLLTSTPAVASDEARGLPQDSLNATTVWPLKGAGTVAAELEEVTGGRLRLKVRAGATEALTVTDLGVITLAGDLSKDLTLRSQSQRTLRSSYKMTTGKQRQRTVLQEESRLLFTNPAGTATTPTGASLNSAARREGQKA